MLKCSVLLAHDTRFIAGVVAYEPAIVLGDKKDGTPPVTLAGNTPVKVTLENGPINRVTHSFSRRHQVMQ